MRPKIVILTLVIAFGVLGAVALLKGVAQKPVTDSGDGAAATNIVQKSGPADTSVPSATANPGAPGSDELRAAVIAKEQDQIRILQSEIDGTNNPVIIAALLDKMNNPEAEVRKAVVQALIEINDTNAVPGLQKAADNLSDPREKVAALDAITYLKAPDIMDGITPEQMTNNYTSGPGSGRPVAPNPRFLRKTPGQAPNNGRQAPAPVPAAPQ
ncbi:MAG: HEAT repeat domain-containing protein [Verrucomicrobiota bacterium]|jgi:hypothetical protein